MSTSVDRPPSRHPDDHPSQLRWLAMLDMLDIVETLRAAGCVFAEDEAAVLSAAATSPKQLSELVARRASGQPLELVVGWAEFCGRRFVIDPDVFVPRRRTEFLVEHAAQLAKHDVRPVVVLDLCCGSGAVGVALAEALKDVELHATDIDPAAVRCARHNMQPIGGQVYQGDLDAPLPGSLRGRVAVLVANAPYVPTQEIALLPSEARDFEPRISLDGGPDGTGVQQRIIAVARSWLAPGGRLLTETTDEQLPRLLDAIGEHGLIASTAADDDRDAIVAIGTAPR